MSLEELTAYLARFRLSQFRPGQGEVIEAILAGRDTLCVMPTGGGKSLCYQLPAVIRGGVNLVISPLIALMKDQVDALTDLEIPATFINSSIPPDEQRRRIDEMAAGHYRLVYIAPERLRSAGFLRALSQIQVTSLAVDEAHCISQWGHDFRPDYARLGRFRERLGFPQTIALTATATAAVRADISTVLRLNQPATFVSGFARENLSLQVEQPVSNSAKDQRLVEFIRDTSGSGIIYASTRKNCEHVVELLTPQVNRRLEFYHAGMNHEARLAVQDNFMTGRTPIVVATNAFGMGIDKADLRFVVHYNIPGSIEAYYQEAGRAGRDGCASTCLLLFSYQDRFIHEFFIENSYPSKETVREVYDYLRAFEQDPIEMTLQDIKDELDISLGTQGIANCEHLLEKAGAIERLDSQQNMAGIKLDSDLPTLVELLPRDATTRRKILREIENIVGALRGEMVLFNPDFLARRLDLKWVSIAKGLRQLSELPQIDYVPPFRGRAIHLKDRSLAFDRLSIDWSELQKRKELEVDRLNRVIDFACSRGCRQLKILDYFGDSNRRVCGTCDQCVVRPITHKPVQPTPPGKTANRQEASQPLDAPNESALQFAVQVALSGVARTQGRFGKMRIAQMLIGSESKKVASGGLQRLSTFGLLKPLRQEDVVLLLDWLLGQGRLNQNESVKFRPTISISTTGVDWMQGKFEVLLNDRIPAGLGMTLSRTFRGQIPKVSGSRQAPAGVSAGLTGPPSARDEAPPVSSLKRSARPDPPDPNPTLGPDRTSPNPAASSAAMTGSEPRVDLPHSSIRQPSYYWTWRLSADGYDWSQICEVRNLDKRGVLDHLLMAAENRLPLDLPSLLRNATDSDQRLLAGHALEAWLAAAINTAGCPSPAPEP